MFVLLLLKKTGFSSALGGLDVVSLGLADVCYAWIICCLNASVFSLSFSELWATLDFAWKLSLETLRSTSFFLKDVSVCFSEVSALNSGLELVCRCCFSSLVGSSCLKIV
jgi:hypothetical protein